ncbi:MAG: hypothetical protein PHH54_03500 [Candidatus Nanoarchaeia archaeon]|nr:hypothetical protein [Candidatus Nanoarchaeia archaeon]MDD5741023.1 hypothetical protein [Candidatus Nanoarchaeia archaeon]
MVEPYKYIVRTSDRGIIDRVARTMAFPSADDFNCLKFAERLLPSEGNLTVGFGAYFSDNLYWDTIRGYEISRKLTRGELDRIKEYSDCIKITGPVEDYNDFSLCGGPDLEFSPH